MRRDPGDLLRELPGCARLSTEGVDQLHRASREEQFEPGTLLVAEGQPAPDWYCIVVSGAIEVSRRGAAADETLARVSARGVLDPGIPGSPALWSASVAKRARCLLVPKAAVSERRAGNQAQSLGGTRAELSLFRSRVHELVKGPMVACPDGTSVAGAARLMSERRVGSVIVQRADGSPLGIVTDRDLRTRVLAAGLSPTTPVSGIMSSPVLCIDGERLAFDGLMEMIRRDIHHLGVEVGGRLAGVVSSHDAMWLQGAHPVALAREIESSQTIEDLATAAPRVEAAVRWLVRGGASVLDVGRIVAELNDRLARRAVSLAEDSLESAGRGRPPVPYSWVAVGSEGRREQTLKTDQDNGLVYEDPPESLRAEAMAYFEGLAAEATATLIRLGFPKCEGGFMASNPTWCQPASVWRGYFEEWMAIQHPQHLLKACIFFDLRPVAGAAEPGLRLWDWVCERTPSQRLFLRYMARAAVERQPPLGVFGGFVVERSGSHKDTIDLKGRGVFPMTQAMRVYALSLGIPETNTVDRLREARERGTFGAQEAVELEEAFEVICRVRLLHQLACVDAGTPADNFINPETLNKVDRLLLKEAFKTLGWLQRGLEERFLTASLV